MSDGDPPESCPACDGDPSMSQVGWVCADCGAWLSTVDSRGRDRDRGDGDDGADDGADDGG